MSKLSNAIKRMRIKFEADLLEAEYSPNIQLQRRQFLLQLCDALSAFFFLF